MNKLHKSGVVILDFGSQYTQLIARRIREQNVYSEILPPETEFNEILCRKPAALILSGGPSSVYEKDAPDFDSHILYCEIPTLGICYGFHLLAQHQGGVVESTGHGEYGFAEITADNEMGLLSDISSPSKVWMSHGDRIKHLPEGWQTLALSLIHI